MTFKKSQNASTIQSVSGFYKTSTKNELYVQQIDIIRPDYKDTLLNPVTIAGMHRDTLLNCSTCRDTQNHNAMQVFLIINF